MSKNTGFISKGKATSARMLLGKGAEENSFTCERLLTFLSHLASLPHFISATDHGVVVAGADLFFTLAAVIISADSSSPEAVAHKPWLAIPTCYTKRETEIHKQIRVVLFA